MPCDLRRNARRAYTLIELLLVVAILGLAGSLLVPNIVGRDSLRAQAAVRRIIADLSFAQSDALAHQEYRRVEFFDGGGGYGIARVGEADYALDLDPDDADWISDPLGSPGALGRYVVDFANDDRFAGVEITAVDVDGGNTFVVYDPLGGTVMGGDVPGTGGAIEVAAGDEAYRITIAAFTGKLTVARIVD